MSSSKANYGGCAPIVSGLILLALALLLLRVIWWLLLILAAIAFIAAFVVRAKSNKPQDQEKPPTKEPFRTQICPHCAGTVKISAYESEAICEYCGLTVSSDRKPLQRESDASEGARSGSSSLSPFSILLVVAVTLAILGVVGYAYDISATQSEAAKQAEAEAPKTAEEIRKDRMRETWLNAEN